MSQIPSYVRRPIEVLREHPDWRGCCVPLAVAMMLRADFEDVVIAMRAMGILRPGGGVSSGSDLPLFFSALGIEVKRCNLRLEAAVRGRSTRPTVTQYFGSLDPKNRHILTKNGHAIYADRREKQVFDYRGVFPERRCRMNHHFELSPAECVEARQGLTAWLEAYYKRHGISRQDALRRITFKGVKRREVRRRVSVSSAKLRIINER